MGLRRTQEELKIKLLEQNARPEAELRHEVDESLKVFTMCILKRAVETREQLKTAPKILAQASEHCSIEFQSYKLAVDYWLANKTQATFLYNVASEDIAEKAKQQVYIKAIKYLKESSLKKPKENIRTKPQDTII